VLVGQHLFGVTTLDQATPEDGAQDASAQIGPHLGHDSLAIVPGHRPHCSSVNLRLRFSHRKTHTEINL